MRRPRAETENDEKWNSVYFFIELLQMKAHAHGTEKREKGFHLYYCLGMSFLSFGVDEELLFLHSYNFIFRM